MAASPLVIARLSHGITERSDPVEQRARGPSRKVWAALAMVSVASLSLVWLGLAGWECIPPRPKNPNNGVILLSKRGEPPPVVPVQHQLPAFCAVLDSVVAVSFVMAWVVVLGIACLTGVCGLCCICQAPPMTEWNEG